MVKRKRLDIEVLDAAAEDGTTAPFVAYFAAGRSEKEGESVDSFNLLRNVRRSKYTLLYASLAGVEFKGAPPKSDEKDNMPCSYALAVCNKTTGKLHLVPIAGGNIRRVESRPSSLDYKPKKGVDNADDSSEARRARNKRLVASFGSTRRVRQMRSYEAGVVHSSHVSGAGAVEQAIVQAAQAAQAAGHTREQVLEHATTSSRILPPHHPDATSASDAYRMHEVLPDHIRNEIKIRKILDMARAQQEEGGASSQELPYVVSRLPLLRDYNPGTSDSKTPVPTAAAKRSARLLVYLSALIRLHQARRIMVDTERGWPAITGQLHLKFGYEYLAEPLLQLFYTRSVGSSGQAVYELPQAQHSLMLRYVLVVALMLEKFNMAPAQFDALRAELKMTAQDMVAQFRELGATADVARGAQRSPGKGAGAEQEPSYTVTLLQKRQKAGAAAEPKTLQQCFPALKVGRRQAKR